MSAYDTILAALDQAGVKVQAGSTTARAQCPVHQSRGLTLSVRCCDDRAMVHCFAGCETPEVLEAIGLALRDLYDEPGRPSTSTYRLRGPLGDVDHLTHRMTVQHRLEVSPEYQARRAAELAAAEPRAADSRGGAVATW